MAEFSKVMITSQGHALIAKLIAGTGNIEFTKICSSSAKHTLGELEPLTELDDIKQTSLVSKVLRVNEVSVQIEAAFTNTDLTEGYFMRTLGLYAVDPDIGEILYAVTIETSGSCYLPPYNGIAVSGAYIQLLTTVGNAENVTLEVDAAAVATIGDIKVLQKQIDDMRGILTLVFEDYTSGNVEIPEIDESLSQIISGKPLGTLLQYIKASLIYLKNQDSYYHDEDNIESDFLQNFTKVDIPESDALSFTEIKEAVAYPYNGEASEDDEALQPEEINESVNSEWHGEGSEDDKSLSPDEVLEACR